MPKYEGERLGNLRHGRGRCFYPNGDIYEGEWKSDKVKIIFVIFLKIKIYLKNKKRHGYGILKD